MKYDREPIAKQAPWAAYVIQNELNPTMSATKLICQSDSVAYDMVKRKISVLTESADLWR